MQSTSTRKRKASSTSGDDGARKRHLCPHCGNILSYSAFFAHMSRFYDSKNEVWIQQHSPRECHVTESEEEMQDCSVSSHVENDTLDNTLVDITNGHQQASTPVPQVPHCHDSDEDVQVW